MSRLIENSNNSKNKNVVRKGFKNGSNHPNWKGGRKLHTSGYWMIRKPDHPRAKGNNGYVFEHILVMEQHLGRYITTDEVVHHIDENRQNNDLSNLRLLDAQSKHMTHHMTDKHYCLGKHIDTSDRVCFQCGSNETYIRKPNNTSKIKTPYPSWHHLPWDKINWYCDKCRKKLISSKH